MIPISRSTCDPRLPKAWNAISPEETESVLKEYIHEDGRKRHILRDFFTSSFPDYCRDHQVPECKLKVMNSLISCKTGKLGYSLIRCDTCGRTEMRACACGNRNCPSCGYLNVIPGIPYFHLVFTLPHDLGTIMYQNQRTALNLLFRSAANTVLTLTQDRLRMTPSILMVLHTFGSDLSLHYHVHMLVSGGGLTRDRKEFKKCPSNTFFLPARALRSVYKGKFMDGLKRLHDDGILDYYNDAEKYRNSYVWKELLDTCYKADWNVEIKPLSPVREKTASAAENESTGNAISYFARYTNRTAISDSRIEAWDDQSVRFRYKDYNGSSYSWKSMDLSADEFIRRFLMHILPAGFMRVRSAGLLAGCVKKKNLILIHELLNRPYKESPVRHMKAVELIRYFYGRDVTVCEKCHTKLEIFPRMSRISAVMFIRAS